MTQHGFATVVGSMGVGLLLLAFFLNLFRFIRTEGYSYLLLNLVGGSLACFSSYLISFIPFVVLEGTWAAVAALGLGKKLLIRQSPESQSVSRRV